MRRAEDRRPGTPFTRHVAALTVLAALYAATANAQDPRPGVVGGPCSAGEYARASLLLVCGTDGTFRYALREDMPPVPDGGFLARPAWFPRLRDVLPAVDPPACPLTGRVTFTAPVIAEEDLSLIIPQGMMVRDHVQPIDHGYIGVVPLAKALADRTEADYVAVRAPADAEVLEVSLLGQATSIRVVMAHGCETYSIYMVLNRLSGALAHLEDDLLARGSVRPNLRVLAGEEFGRQRDNPLDFSVHDGATWLTGYVSPFSYTSSESWRPYTVDPWPYFAPDLQVLYISRMQRLEAPRWGRIDLDIRGTAAGSWYLDGTLGYSGHQVATVQAASGAVRGGMVDGKLIYAWSHLALVRHWVQTSQWIFSTGWWTDERGDPVQYLLEPEPGQLAPDQLTPASGVVVYRLRAWNAATPSVNQTPYPIGYDIAARATVGFVAVQVREDDAISVDVFPGLTTAPAFPGFSSSRRLYRR